MARKARIPMHRPARPAVADKAAALDAADYLESRAARASRARFRRALAKVPDAAPRGTEDT